VPRSAVELTGKRTDGQMDGWTDGRIRTQSDDIRRFSVFELSSEYELMSTGDHRPCIIRHSRLKVSPSPDPDMPCIYNNQPTSDFYWTYLILTMSDILSCQQQQQDESIRRLRLCWTTS
jgi:hypothetical protein